jgi:hypothetical protein
VWVFAGSVALSAPPAGCSIRAISPPGLDLPEALRQTAANLELTLRKKLE